MGKNILPTVSEQEYLEAFKAMGETDVNLFLYVCVCMYVCSMHVYTHTPQHVHMHTHTSLTLFRREFHLTEGYGEHIL